MDGRFRCRSSFPRQPRYIETVSRRGYRFVARLADVAVSDSPAPATAGVMPAPEAGLVGRATALTELWRCVPNANTGKALAVVPNGCTLDLWGNYLAGFSAKTAIDRRDFGFTGNLALDLGGVVIGERIEIEILVEATGQPAVRAT